MIEEPERILAKLFHDTEGLFTREQFLELSDWDINNWLCRPDANAGSENKRWYWPVDRENRDDPVVQSFGSDARSLWMNTRGKAMKTMGSSEEEIAEACEKYLHPRGAGSGWKEDRRGRSH